MANLETMARNMAEMEEGISVTAGRLDTDSFFEEVAQRKKEHGSGSMQPLSPAQKEALHDSVKAHAED